MRFVSGTSATGSALSGASGELPVATEALALPAAAVTSDEALALVGCLAIADAKLSQAKVAVSDAERRRSESQIRARHALESARRAMQKSSSWGSFGAVMGSVAKWAGIAAVAGSAVATGGASLAPTLVIIGASAASFAMRQSGADVSVCSIGGVEFRASELLMLGACAAGLCAGAPANGDSASVAALVARGAAGVGAGATAGRAVAAQREGHFEAEATRSRAGALSEELAAEHELEAIRDAIDAMRESSAYRSRALDAVTNMLETRRAAQAALFGRRA